MSCIVSSLLAVGGFFFLVRRSRMVFLGGFVGVTVSGGFCGYCTGWDGAGGGC